MTEEPDPVFTDVNVRDGVPPGLIDARLKLSVNTVWAIPAILKQQKIIIDKMTLDP